MSEYIVTCDEETAAWIGNDVDSMQRIDLIEWARGMVRRKIEVEGEALERALAEVGFVRERTCRDVSVDSSTQFYCSECECTVDMPILWGAVNYCPNCGAKVACSR